MDNSAAKELDIKDAKTSSEEKKNEEKMSQCSGDACKSVVAKGEKRTNEGKKSKEGSFVGKFCNVNQLVSAAEAESTTKEKAENVCKRQATSDVEKKEREDDKILFSSAEDFKDSNKIKNSNLGQSVAVEDSGREQSSSDSSECGVQTVIEVKVPRKREEEVKKCVITDDRGINSVPGGNNDKATATGTEEQPSKDAGAEKKEKEKLACFFDKLLKASPPKGEVMLELWILMYDIHVYILILTIIRRRQGEYCHHCLKMTRLSLVENRLWSIYLTMLAINVTTTFTIVNCLEHELLEGFLVQG